MIIFTSFRQVPESMLEAKDVRQVITFNLSSYYSDVPTLNKLSPSPEFIPEELLQGNIGDNTNFDAAYCQYVTTNAEAFSQLMSIIIPVYNYPDTLVQILIQNSEFRDSITEALIKLIQQRSYILNEPDDFMYTEESTFSIPGLFNLDQDLDRWRLMNAGNNYGELVGED